MGVKEVLEDIGLTPNEVKVYKTLLRLGSAKAGKISKDAQTNRTCTYDALRRLINKGLVSYVYIGNKKWFQPAHPKRILELLQQKKEDAKKILPDLEDLYKQTKLKQNVTLYKGLKGIKTVFQDILREQKENLVYGSEGQFVQRMPIYSKQFLREQVNRKIKTKLIVRKGRKAEGSKVTEVRYVPEDIESPVVTNIYGNKIALILWTDTPEAVIVENKAAADSYRAYFKLLWKQAKRQ
jgi:sugar-specific transcriptional regulator TrmB